MNERIHSLRQSSHEAKPSISHERAELLTDFYLENEGKYSIPVMRGLHFRHQCEKKTVCIGPGELIVGERGPLPKAASTCARTGAGIPAPSSAWFTLVSRPWRAASARAVLRSSARPSSNSA